MAAGEDKRGDLYAVLGLSKECTAEEMRSAYKKLAMKWHPDRCSSSGSLNRVEEAKNKFQAIQQAYSVLSDANKRFLYDVGVYDSDDDDDENGMGEFLNEMASMMSRSQQKDNRNASFEELQQLFDEIFHNDSDSSASSHGPHPTRESSPPSSCYETHSISNKRNSCHMSSSSYSIEASQFERFCMGENITLEQVSVERIQGGPGGSRRDGRKQKTSSGHDVSSGECSSISLLQGGPGGSRKDGRMQKISSGHDVLSGDYSNIST